MAKFLETLGRIATLASPFLPVSAPIAGLIGAGGQLLSGGEPEDIATGGLYGAGARFGIERAGGIRKAAESAIRNLSPQQLAALGGAGVSALQGIKRSRQENERARRVDEIRQQLLSQLLQTQEF